MGEPTKPDEPLKPGEVLRIVPDQTLKPGEWLLSPNREYRMGLVDGRMVIKHDATGETVWQQEGKDGREAVEIIFETERGDGAENRLELHDRRDKELWGANVDHAGTRGPAAKGEWDDYDDGTDHVPAQYVLTNDGQLLLVKDKLPDDWKGDNLTNLSPNVLWFNQNLDLQEAARRREVAAHRKYVEGLDRDPKEGDKLSTFPLEIRVPPGSVSALLKPAIDAANSQLNYLAFQMGQKKKPDALQSPDKGDDTNPWDDNLRLQVDGVFLRPVPKPGDTGESVDAYKSTEAKLSDLAVRWNAMDEKFKIADQTLTLDNAQTYKRMYDTVQDAHEKIWAHLKTGTEERSPGQPARFLYTEFGIQDLSEELKVYEIIKDTVNSCAKEVTDYTNRSAELAKKFGDFPGYPSEKSDGNGGGGANNGNNGNNGANNSNNASNNATNNGNNAADNGNNATGNGNNAAGNAAAGYNGAPAPAPDTSAQAADLQNEDFSPTFDDLVSNTDATGSVDGTQSRVGDKSSDTSSSSDFGSGVSAAPQNGVGTVSGTPGQTAGNVAPAANTGGIDMGQIMAMSAMAQMANQGNRVSGDDRADQDRHSRDDRQRDRDRSRIAPAVTATSPGTQQAPPGVTAPMYAGTPPAVTTPGGMVDYKIGNSTVQVSQPVAEALQRQTQNTATNAVAAYD
ncbi:hypothetical protein, partial [Nocardia abscessus]|uniref:hypothetical protein n=1 Tax=Nocardia abscessus TaxID=120957 RepID=UPI0024576F90